MNSRRRRAVQPVVLLVLGLGGCVEVDGGAVELSWTIRTVEGDTSSCTHDPARPITAIGLCVGECDTLVGGACNGPVVCPVDTWRCDLFEGVTGFDVPPGRKQLYITLDCAGAACPPDYVVPEPLVRDVLEGEITQLNALLITVPSVGSKPSPESFTGSKEEPR